MKAIRRRLRPVAWVALWAMWALALLPTVSHALASSGAVVDWVEVCTPRGSALVALEREGGQEPPRSTAIGHLEHCPFCTLGADHAWLPLAMAGSAAVDSAADGLPQRISHAPRTVFAWAGARQRAPPARA